MIESTMTIDVKIPGLKQVAGYLREVEQHELLETIDSLPWCSDLKRRVQHYGYRYDYTRKRIDKDLFLGPLPNWAQALADRLFFEGHTLRHLDQLIVNEYLPGQGISSHTDCVPCFADTVLSLSLGSACVLTMSRDDSREKVPVFLEPGSLLVIKGEARYKWKHGIAPRKTDLYAGQRFVRGRRVSLTFRTVLH